MSPHLQSSLVDAIEDWMDQHGDAIVYELGICFDETAQNRTARAIAAGAVAVLDGMAVQNYLEQEPSGRGAGCL